MWAVLCLITAKPSSEFAAIPITSSFAFKAVAKSFNSPFIFATTMSLLSL